MRVKALMASPCCGTTMSKDGADYTKQDKTKKKKIPKTKTKTERNIFKLCKYWYGLNATE